MIEMHALLNGDGGGLGRGLDEGGGVQQEGTVEGCPWLVPAVGLRRMRSARQVTSGARRAPAVELLRCDHGWRGRGATICCEMSGVKI